MGTQKIWVLFVALISMAMVVAQQRPPMPPQQFRPPPRVPVRDQSNSVSAENSALPQPPIFLTSPSFSFDDVSPSVTTQPTRFLSTSQSTRATRPQIRRPFVRPVEFVQLQQFRPTPRSAQLPIRPRFRQTTSQFRPVTQPAPPLRRVQLTNQAQIRPRFQPQPAPIRRPIPPVQRTPPIRVQPASVPPPATTVQRRPTQSLQIRPLTQPAPPRPQAFSRSPAPQSRPPTSQAFTPGLRTRPTQALPSPSTLPQSTASTTLRRPIPSSPSFASTNSLGPVGPSTTHVSRPHTSASAHPPGVIPPSNSVIDELNRAEDFMAVARRLKLRRFARHRNRRHADFIYRQQMKNL